jgi:hypothetical protein
VLTRGADLRLIVMAQDAGVLACIGDRLGADELESARAVVAVAAEAFGDDRGAGDEEDTQADDEHDRGSNQVGPIPEQAFQDVPFQMRIRGERKHVEDQRVCNSSLLKAWDFVD